MSAANQVVHAFNWTDCVIITIIILSALVSVVRGFVRECFSLATWITAFILSFNLCDYAAKIFTSFVETDSLRVALGFALIFVIVLIIGGIASHIIVQLISKTGLSAVDRFMGLIFGAVKGLLIITVVLMLVNVASASHGKWYTDSYLIPHFQALVDLLAKFLPDRLLDLVKNAAK